MVPFLLKNFASLTPQIHTMLKKLLKLYMKDTMLMFARSADALTDLQVEKIRKIIDGVKDE